MDSESEQIMKLPMGCRIKPTLEVGKDVGFDDLFNHEWEVFVVKKNDATGKYVGKVACCALSPV